LKWLITSTANRDINPSAPAIDLVTEAEIPPQYPVTDTSASKYGLLDVKAAIDALDKLESRRSRRSGGCNAGIPAVALIVFIVFQMCVWRKRRNR
jgi:hypothetical protein